MNYDIRKRMVKIILLNTDDNKENFVIGDNTKIIEDLGFDSVSIMNLILELEKEFDFDFLENDNIIDIFSSIRSLQEYIESRINP